MHKSVVTPQLYVEVGCGHHEQTLLSVVLLPWVNRECASFALGLSLLYWNLFYVEFVWFWKPRKIYSYSGVTMALPVED